MQCFAKAETTNKPPILSMFEDVYKAPIPILVKQREELKQHLEKYGEHYPIDKHIPDEN